MSKTFFLYVWSGIWFSNCCFIRCILRLIKVNATLDLQRNKLFFIIVSKNDLVLALRMIYEYHQFKTWIYEVFESDFWNAMIIKPKVTHIYFIAKTNWLIMLTFLMIHQSPCKFLNVDRKPRITKKWVRNMIIWDLFH